MAHDIKYHVYGLFYLWAHVNEFQPLESPKIVIWRQNTHVFNLQEVNAANKNEYSTIGFQSTDSQQ